MVIKWQNILIGFCVANLVYANPQNPVSFAANQTLPSTMTVGVSYPLEYTFTNNTNFYIRDITVSVNPSIGEYSGTFSTITNGCLTTLSPGSACTWSGQFTPTSATSNILSLKFSYGGNEYILPTNASTASSATCERVGDVLTEVFDIELLGDTLFAAGDDGVTYTSFSNPSSWQVVGSDINMSRVIQLEVNNNTLYAAGIATDNIGVKSHSATSLDSGAWSAFGNNTNEIYLGLLLHDSTFYATTFSGTVFSIAANALPASAWAQFGTNSIGSTYSGQPIVNGDNILVPYLPVQYNSISNPTNWSSMVSAGGVVANLAVNNNTLFAVGNGFGVRSHSVTDLSGDWDTFGTGLTTQRTKSIAILNDNTLLVGGDGTQGGVLYTNSIPSPGAWTTLCALGNDVAIWNIKILNGVAYLATDIGVFKLT